MNATETAAYEWLKRQGYADEDIAYQYTRSPDFVTADGRGWEVKLPIGRVIQFGAKQICDIRHFGNTTVLVWRRDALEPVVSAAFDELTIPGEWGGYLLRANWQPKFDGPQPLKTVAAVEEIVARYVAQDRKRRAMPLREAVA